MRRVASSRFRKTLELARNVVNITFPPEFGTPLLVKTPDGMVAMFPDHVRMQALINDRSVILRPIGEGYSAETAMIDLFGLFAAYDSYEDIIVHDKKFCPQESPYSTIIFQRQRLADIVATL